MNNHQFEDTILGLFNCPINFPGNHFDDLKKILPIESQYIPKMNYTSLLAILICANSKRDLKYLAQLNDELKTLSKQITKASPHALRSIESALNLISYSAKNLSNLERSELIGKLYSALFDILDHAHNLIQLKKTVFKEFNSSKIPYYENLRLSTTRYFSVSSYGITLFNTLKPEEDALLRKAEAKQPMSDLNLNNALQAISEKVKERLDKAVGENARKERFVQVISSGRSGTYFLRNQLMNHSENIVPIHNIHTIPSLNVRSLMSIIQMSVISEQKENIYISSRQLDSFSHHVEQHLFIFCIELIGYSSRFHRLPVIINHWWSPFAILLKSLLPNLEFVSLTRNRDSLKYSMVSKHQISSNPMPPCLLFSDFDLSSDKQTDLNKWSEYYIDFVGQLQSAVFRLFPDSCSASISLTPPNEAAAKKLIEIFDLNCSPEKIIESPIANFKKTSNPIQI